VQPPSLLIVLGAENIRKLQVSFFLFSFAGFGWMKIGYLWLLDVTYLPFS